MNKLLKTNKLNFWLAGCTQYDFDNLKEFKVREDEVRLGRNGAYILFLSNLYFNYSTEIVGDIVVPVEENKTLVRCILDTKWMRVSDFGSQNPLDVMVHENLFWNEGLDVGVYSNIVLEKPMFWYNQFDEGRELVLIGFNKNRDNNKGPIWEDP